MAHNRITVSEYDKDMGVCAVAKSSKFGEVTGLAFCHPEDDDVKNMFTGSYIAEHRADTMLTQIKAANYAARVQGMEHLKNVLNTKLDSLLYKDGYDKPDEFAEIRKFIDKQISIAKRDAKIEHDKFLRFKKDDREFAERLVKEKREFRKNHPVK